MQDNAFPAHPLADTSALVLLWCGHEIYRTEAAGIYAGKLDLQNGLELMRRCNAIWPEYGSVIRYRKLCIAETTASLLEKEGINQVLIPGAGFSMLGIDLAAAYPDLQVFESDRDFMEEKQLLVDDLPSAGNSRLHCLTADITDTTACRHVLSSAGWNPAKPTLLILEGISYYVPKKALRRQWELLPAGSPVILEYLVPPETVSAAKRHIPEKIFGEIISYCGSHSRVTCWSEEELQKEMAVTLETCLSLSDIENGIGPAKKLFPERKDGWIEIAMLRRKKTCQPASVLPASDSGKSLSGLEEVK